MLNINGEIVEDEDPNTERTTTSKIVSPSFSGVVISTILDWIKEKLEHLRFLCNSSQINQSRYEVQIDWICQQIKGPMVTLEILSRTKLNIKQYGALEDILQMAFDWLFKLCLMISGAFERPDGTYYEVSKDKMSPLVELVENVVQKIVKNIYELFPFIQQLETEALKEMMAKQQSLKGKRKNVSSTFVLKILMYRF